MVNLYRNEHSVPKFNAQRNLCGRTNYVNDNTLRFHKSRIISARATSDGLLFWIVTSDAIDYQNTRRGFRFVIFDLFGTVLERTELEATFRTSEQAQKAMYEALNKLDAVNLTHAAIRKQIENHRREMDEMSSRVQKIGAEHAA